MGYLYVCRVYYGVILFLIYLFYCYFSYPIFDKNNEACTITICDSLLSILLYIFVRINRQMKYIVLKNLDIKLSAHDTFLGKNIIRYTYSQLVFRSSSSPRVLYFVGSRPDRVTPKSITLVFVASPVNTQYLAETAQTGWLGIRIMCPSRAIRIFVSCCYSDLAL